MNTQPDYEKLKVTELKVTLSSLLVELVVLS